MSYEYQQEEPFEQLLREHVAEIIAGNKFTQRFLEKTDSGEERPILTLGGYNGTTRVLMSLGFASTERQEEEISIYYGSWLYQLTPSGAYVSGPDVDSERLDFEDESDLKNLLARTDWQNTEEVREDLINPKQERQINQCLTDLDEMMTSTNPSRAMLRHSLPLNEARIHKPVRETHFNKAHVVIGSLAIGGMMAIYVWPLFGIH